MGRFGNPRELGLDWVAGIWPMAAIMVLLTVQVMLWVTLSTGCGGLDVLLPESRTPGVIPDAPRPLAITIRADGSTFVGGNWIPEEHLGEVLQRIPPGRQAAVVSADRRLRFSAVTRVLATASTAGFSKLYLEVEGDPLRAWLRPPAIQ